MGQSFGANSNTSVSPVQDKNEHRIRSVTANEEKCPCAADVVLGHCGVNGRRGFTGVLELDETAIETRTIRSATKTLESNFCEELVDMLATNLPGVLWNLCCEYALSEDVVYEQYRLSHSTDWYSYIRTRYFQELWCPKGFLKHELNDVYFLNFDRSFVTCHVLNSTHSCSIIVNMHPFRIEQHTVPQPERELRLDMTTNTRKAIRFTHFRTVIETSTIIDKLEYANWDVECVKTRLNQNAFFLTLDPAVATKCAKTVLSWMLKSQFRYHFLMERVSQEIENDLYLWSMACHPKDLLCFIERCNTFFTWS